MGWGLKLNKESRLSTNIDLPLLPDCRAVQGFLREPEPEPESHGVLITATGLAEGRAGQA